MNIPENQIQYNAFQNAQVLEPGVVLVPGFISEKTAKTIVDNQQEDLNLFPACYDESTRIPLLPYIRLNPAFRQLLCEINSSVSIRKIENTLGKKDLLPDPLLSQAAVCSIEKMSVMWPAIRGNSIPTGLETEAGLAICINNQNNEETAAKIGDCILFVESCDLKNLGKKAGGMFLFCFLYRFKSLINHERIKFK